MFINPNDDCKIGKLMKVAVIFNFLIQLSYCDEDVFMPVLPTEEFQYIALRACSMLNVDKKAKMDCQKLFLSSEHKNNEIPPKVNVLCKDENTVILETPPSHANRMIVLVSNNTHIKFDLLTPKETRTMFSPFKTDYQIFAAALGPEGDTSFWRVGPVLRTSNASPKTISKPIELKQVGNFVYKDEVYKNMSVDATFTWDPYIDTCNVVILNKCNKAPTFRKEIYAQGNRTVIIEELPFNDDCTLTVKGGNRKGVLDYHTPIYTKKVNTDQCATELLKDVVVATRVAASGSGSDVIVQWSKPTCLPLKYVAELLWNHHINVTAPENATEIILPNINGTGLFAVKLSAVYREDSAVAIRRGIFPPSEPTVSSSAALIGACASTLLLVTAAVALVCLCRRRTRKPTNFYFPDLEEKPTKDFLIDASGVGVGLAEDGWELRPDRLLLHEVLGEGAFGIVRKANLTPSNKEVAVKMLKEFPSVEEVRSFRTEMELMKSIGAHAHVVSLVGCCSGRRPCIVVEYCSRGDLLNYLRCAWDLMVSKRKEIYYNHNNEYGTDYRDVIFKTKCQTKLTVNKLYDLQGVCDTELTPVDLLSFCRQIAKGMEFLASNRVVHRDLAARNVLICGDKTLKIADFGLSRDVYQDNQYKQKGNGKLPIKWMALESLTHRLYTTQSDVWSFGVVIWEVVTVGGAPYPGVAAARLPRLLRAGYRMPRPNNCTEQLYEIVMSCWKARPRDRPTFSELHEKLDALLHNATTADYLTLQIDDNDRPLTPKHNRYRAWLSRNKLNPWGVRNGEVYECSKKTQTQSNHYTSPPDTLSRPQPV